MNLFLDDLRFPPDDGRAWTIVRSCGEARQFCLNLGFAPSLISFDHDLGVEAGEDGHEFAKWLVEMDLDRPGFIPKDFEFHIHSANPTGAGNIRGLLQGYLDFRSR